VLRPVGAKTGVAWGKGDVFDLVQFLDPGLNFGQGRQVRRRLVGIAPTFPKALRDSARVTSDATISERWNAPVGYVEARAPGTI
jgi:hypothetical protein